jgi:hypothetical protein
VTRDMPDGFVTTARLRDRDTSEIFVQNIWNRLAEFGLNYHLLL